MISIFISSTFMDMQVERDLLQKEVLPELRDYARQFGEEVQFIDLRWGVDLSKVDEEKVTETILEVCFKNIEDSEPYFLGLLGERYGTLIEKDRIPTPDLKAYIGKSLTEAEIEFGVFADRSKKSLFLFREPLEENVIPNESRTLYLEEDQKERIERLKEKIKSKVPEERVLSYQGSWDENNLILKDFSHTVTSILKKMIREDLKIEADLSDQEHEINTMHYFIMQKAHHFKARKNDLERIKDLLKDKSLILIQGEAGSGKSTLLSALTEELKEKGEVIPIVSNLTSRSQTAENILLQQIWALEKILGKENFTEVNETTTVEQLQDGLSNLLSQLPKDKPLYILIDALDQLEIDNLRDSLGFLPRRLREGDRVLITFLDDLKITGKNRYGKARLGEYRLNDLKEEEALEVINSSRAYREIPEEVIEEILKKNQSNNPLYISLLVNKLFLLDAPHFREIASHNQDSKDHTAEHLKQIITDSPNTLEELSVNLIEEAGESFGKKLTEEVFKILSFSRRGFTVSALEKIIGNEFVLLDFELLSKYLDNMLIRQNDGRIDFSHRIIREGLRTHFKDQKKESSNQVYKYLKDLDDLDPLKLREFLYYCIQTEDFEGIITYLLRLLVHGNEKVLNKLAEEIKNLLLEEGSEWFLEIISQITQNNATFFNFIDNYLPYNIIWSFYNLQILEELYKSICKKLLELLSETDNKVLQSNLSQYYNRLAFIQNSLGEFEKAYKNYLQSVRLREKLVKQLGTSGIKWDLMVTLDNLGFLQWNLEENEEALKSFLRAEEIGEELVEQLTTPDIKKSLANTLNNLGVIQHDLGEDEKAQESYSKAKDLREELVEYLDTPKSKLDLAGTLNNLGNLQKDLGENQSAFDNFNKAKELLEVLVEKLDIPEYKIKLAGILTNLGILQSDLRKNKEAYKYYLKAIELREDVVEQLATPRDISELADTIFDLGLLQRELGEEKKAQENYLKAKELKEKLVEQLGTSKVKSDLAEILSSLGNLQRATGDTKAAMENFFRALELRKELVEQLQTFESKLKLSKVLADLGSLQRALGKDKEAYQNYLKSKKIREDLEKNLGTPETKSNLADILNDLGLVLIELGDNNKAQESYLKARALREQLVELLGTSETKSKLALVLNNLGSLQKDQGDYLKANENYHRAKNYYTELDDLLENPETKSDLADVLNNLGILQNDLGKNKEALENYKMAMELREELVKMLGTSESKLKLAQIQNNLGNLLHDLGDNKGAQENYLRAIELREELVNQLETPDIKSSLALVLTNLANLQRDQGQNDSAQVYYSRAIKIEEELFEQIGTPKVKLDLAFTWNNLGILQGNLGDNELAKESFLKAIKIGEELVNTLESPKVKSNLALYLNNLGISLYYLKEYKEAYEAFSKALELRKKLYEESVSPRAESEYLDTLNNVKVVKRELDKLN